MRFNEHSELEGKHSFLSPSNYHWVNYSEEKLINVYSNFLATQRGTRLHAFAKESIELGIKLPKSKHTLNMYVNDAIGYGMVPEQVLYFSRNCFGTADAILFRKGFLRIHDLKTGVSPVSMTQLEVYAALFCLEYVVRPSDIRIELRIYQNDEIQVLEPDPNDIYEIMNTITVFDANIEDFNADND